MLTDVQDYFRQPVFQLLAKELQRRYWLKEEFGKSIGLSLFGQTDTEPLRGFLGITALSWDKKKRISIVELEQAFLETVLGWSLQEFITFVVNEPLSIKREQEQAAKQSLEKFKAEVASIDPNFTRLLTDRQLNEWSNKKLSDMAVFKQVAAALKKLSKNEFIKLPVFAYEVTGDPHAFDENKDGGRLLIQVLTALSNQTAESLEELEKAEQRHGLLAEFHLLKDDVKNYAAIKGLTAFDRENVENQMWRLACIEGVSWNVPLKEILRMATIRPYTGDKVLVVENSGMYSILAELFPEISIVCSSGQFTFSIWQLLRKLAVTGVTLYYSGDIDPEGLGMAQKLKAAFGKQVRFLGMNALSFQNAKTEKFLSDARLKKLRTLKDSQLIELGELILLEESVAYQEGFLQELMREIRREVSS